MSTADLLDRHPDALVCELAFRQFGGVTAFAGPISTIRCHEDNVLLKQQVAEPGEGRVLVVDGGGSLRVALLGDMVAGLAAANGWVGRGRQRLRARRRRCSGTFRSGSRRSARSPRPSGKAGAGEIDVPVEFGGDHVPPGSACSRATTTASSCSNQRL